VLKDNAVIHHFQHICAVFFGVMMASIYLGHTLNAMASKGWIDSGIISAVFFSGGFVSVIFWFLWFTRTKEDDSFDMAYRVLLLVSGVIAAILGRSYVGV
jgi:uncharacterized membrane protein